VVDFHYGMLAFHGARPEPPRLSAYPIGVEHPFVPINLYIKKNLH